MLCEIGAEPVEVRRVEQLQHIDGLIIPGGESTTIGKLLVSYHMLEPLKHLIASGQPVWGTCAGLILLAKDIGGLRQPLIGALDVRVRRNAMLQRFQHVVETRGACRSWYSHHRG